jgi:hypothetical protein
MGEDEPLYGFFEGQPGRTGSRRKEGVLGVRCEGVWVSRCQG